MGERAQRPWPRPTHGKSIWSGPGGSWRVPGAPAATLSSAASGAVAGRGARRPRAAQRCPRTHPPRSPPGEGTPLYAAGDGQAPARGAGALTSTLPVPPLRGSDPILGARTGNPHPGPLAVPASLRSLPNFPAPTALRASPPPGRRPSTRCRARPGRRAEGCPGRGRRARVGSPPALGGARRAGYKASARWSLRLLLAQSISARRSRAPAGPAPPGAAGHTSPRPPAPGASPGANFAGPRGGGGRRRPPVPGRSPPPSPGRPPARSPSTAASSGNSSSAAPSLRRAMAALPGASGRSAAGPWRPGRERAPRARGAGGERRGAAHTQPPPPRSQQNEPSSRGRTGTRAPPALGAAHLSRERGGSPARPRAPARAPAAPPARARPRSPQPLASAGAPRGPRARRSAETPRAPATESPGSPRAAVVSPGAVAPPDKAAISAQMFLNFY